MLRLVRSGLHPPPRTPTRTGRSWSPTNGAHFVGISAGSNPGRAVSAAGRGRDGLEFDLQSLRAANPFLAPSRVALKTGGIKPTNRASRIGATTRQEHRAGE